MMKNVMKDVGPKTGFGREEIDLVRAINRVGRLEAIRILEERKVRRLKKEGERRMNMDKGVQNDSPFEQMIDADEFFGEKM